METARESSKDQPVVRKTEPLSSSDPWQQEWGREEKTNTTKVPNASQSRNVAQFPASNEGHIDATR